MLGTVWDLCSSTHCIVQAILGNFRDEIRDGLEFLICLGSETHSNQASMDRKKCRKNVALKTTLLVSFCMSEIEVDCHHHGQFSFLCWEEKLPSGTHRNFCSSSVANFLANEHAAREC